MKVLFISSGNVEFGISIIVKNQGESLRKAGIDVNYFTIKGKGIFSYLKHIFILHTYLRENDFDIFHAHYSLSGFTASLAGCKPLIVSLMGSDIKSGIIEKQIIRLFCFFRWKSVVVKSYSLKKDIGLKKAVIISNGVNLDLVKPSIKKRSSEKKIVLFGADPDRNVKNFSLAEKAVSLLHNDNIVLRTIHSLPHDELIGEINNSDVLLITSLWEGSPNLVKEAMACNCPVVATNVGDIAWLFGNEPGHFLTGFNCYDVAEKLRLALSFAQENVRTNGRQRIITLELDSGSIATKLVSLYQSVLKG
jgi:glycosyltransferase involved in cell wall biosynthesis